MFKLVILGRAITDDYLGYNRYSSIIDGLSWSDAHSLVLLPNEQGCRATAALYQRVLSQEIKVCFVPDDDYCLDKVIDESPLILAQIQARLDEFVPRSERIQLIFFRQNPYLISWTRRLKHPISFNIEPATYFSYSMFKSIFHRSILTPDLPAPLEQYACIRVPKGYIAEDKKAILLAWNTLRAAGVEHILVKPVDGYLGKGIETIRDEDDILKLPNRKYVVEEKLNLDRNSWGMETSYATNYYYQNILQITTQLTDDKVYAGSISAFLGSELLRADVEAQSQAFLSWALGQGMQNFGGVDFLVQKDQAFMVDNNIGRMTAAQGAYFFSRTYAPNQLFMTFYAHNTQRSVEAVWQLLLQHHLAFDRNAQTGVFPFAYVQHNMCKMIALHNSIEQVYEIAMQAKMLLEK